MADIKRGKAIYCSVSCSTRKYSVDESYFNDISDQDKAYWLGFIFADGNIYKTSLTIKLNKKDNTLLEMFKSDISSEHPISPIVEESKVFISICSKKISKDLISIGVTPNKTFTIVYPKINPILDRHFIRGYFDGDGCVSLQRGKYNCVNIFTASSEFKDRICDILRSNLIETRVYDRNNGHAIVAYGIDNTNRFYDFIYGDDPNRFLSRKRDKFILKAVISK